MLSLRTIPQAYAPPPLDASGKTCSLSRMTHPAQTHIAFAAMKDEGAFLLEWVAWYRMLGFEVLIGINDCSDHSPELLHILEQAGWLNYFKHSPKDRQPPKNSAHGALRRHPMLQRADWLFICDVDEFLVLHRGDGSIDGFLNDVGRDFSGMAIHWRCFGNSGWQRYKDGFVHQQFRRTGHPANGVNANFKMLIRDPLRFKRFTDHAPVAPDMDWSLPENRIVDCMGREIEKFTTQPHPVRFTIPEQITHDTAQLNHYVIRSDESFDLKRGKPSASAFKDRYTEQFYRARNRNGHRDLSAGRYADWFSSVYEQICAVPGALRLHHLCCADYIARLAALKDVPPERDARWVMHKNAARDLAI